jgi:tetratricopeptide (TPR) repeat protein
MIHRAAIGLLVLVLGAVIGSPSSEAAADDTELAKAQSLLLTGRYEEAAEIFTPLAKLSGDAALGLARCQASVGKLDEAQATLKEAGKELPPQANLSAELARIAFERGDCKAADSYVREALEIDARSALARWIQAELFRVRGQLDEALAGYQWAVDDYNQHEITDAESLRWIGLAAGQFARWKRASDQFGFLVNELYPDAVAQEENFWQAHYETGRLFLEKYNEGEATRSFAAALEINPRSAEVYAAVAALALQRYDLDKATQAIDRALEINPQLTEALYLKSDLSLANFDVPQALERIEAALKRNPVEEEALGRKAAAFAILDGFSGEGDPSPRLAALIEEVTKRNPHAGRFFLAAAIQLEVRRKFDVAEYFFKEALERLPQLIGPRSGLGMMYMRLGRESEAQRLLDASFEIDPFNVRVSNTLKVLEVLADYETIETEHFMIRFDGEKDRILAEAAAQYMEEVYPRLCQQLAYEPREKSLFEIFSQAKNTSGHGWFSARMVGLPYIGTVGACAGTMVAMASPNDGKTKFNWARVMKHEFVHVINLQQTHFNIPHWFTEALAVLNEGYPRPQIWDQLLLERVPEGKVFNLDTINLGFIRPESGLDWQMAYCQAELYAQYMVKTFGEASIGRMLQCYAENLTTPEAIQRSLGVEQADFEQGYQQYLKEITAGLTADIPPKQMELAELEKAQKAAPKDPDLAARLAVELVRRREYPRARKLARDVLKEHPRHQLASYVVARLHLLIGDNEQAIEVLEEAIDEAAPQHNTVALLAGLRLKAKQYDEAARLYGLMSARNPRQDQWIKALARVHLLSGDEQQLEEALKKLAEMDADDVTIRKKLAQMARSRQEWAEAERWARGSLHVDVMDPDSHEMLADALAAQAKHAEAADVYETAVDLNPRSVELHWKLASTCVEAKEPARARQALEDLLELDAQHEEAKQLLEQLSP